MVQLQRTLSANSPTVFEIITHVFSGSDSLNRIVTKKQLLNCGLGTGIEEGWGSTGEAAFGCEVVGFGGAVDARVVDADGDAHKHVLRTFGEAVVDAEEVGGLEGFETEAQGGAAGEHVDRMG